VELWLENELK